MSHFKVSDVFCSCISGIVLVLTWAVHYLFVLNSMLNILAYFYFSNRSITVVGNT